MEIQSNETNSIFCATDAIENFQSKNNQPNVSSHTILNAKSGDLESFVTANIFESLKKTLFSNEEADLLSEIKSIGSEIDNLINDTKLEQSEIESRIKIIKSRIADVSDTVYKESEKNKSDFLEQSDKFLNNLKDFLKDRQNQTEEMTQKIEVEVKQVLQKLVDELSD